MLRINSLLSKNPLKEVQEVNKKKYKAGEYISAEDLAKVKSFLYQLNHKSIWTRGRRGVQKAKELFSKWEEKAKRGTWW